MRGRFTWVDAIEYQGLWGVLKIYHSLELGASNLENVAQFF